MIRKVQFESQERRINQVLAALKENGINSIEEANEICEKAGIDPYQMCEETQLICFENAKWAYVCGAAIAIKKGVKTAAEAAEAIGIGLQSFCIPGSVADDRKVGIGHGNLAARLLREETECFAFLAGHESFATAEGAIKIAEMANKVRQKPLRVILNGLGKDAAQIISRINQVLAALKENGINSIEEANEICDKAGVDPYQMCEDTQRICFENAKWAYVCGAAIAIKKGVKTAADAAEAIGIGLQSFCIPGSVADDRKVGLGHGNLAARLLREETECFAFLAGHESFAAAEGAIKIAEMANKVRQKPLRVILNGLGKDAAQIISRINGFTYVQTQFDYFTSELKVVKEIPYGNNPSRLKVKCYGADDVREGVAILWHENVDVSITGNSTNPTRFQHPVAGTYKKERVLAGKPYFSVASGGGTGRTLHPDNMAAGPASYGMTDTMGRMHSDAQFAGSSSVPAHVEMMGFLGIGNNPMVGATVAIAVAIDLALNKK